MHVYCSAFAQCAPLSMGRDHGTICIHHSDLFITVIPQWFFNVRAYFSDPNQHGAGDTDRETKIDREKEWDGAQGWRWRRDYLFFSDDVPGQLKVRELYFSHVCSSITIWHNHEWTVWKKDQILSFALRCKIEWLTTALMIFILHWFQQDHAM